MNVCWSGATAGGSDPIVSLMLWVARPICLRLLAHLIRAAASRTFCTAGSSSPISTAMIAMTTSSSISVNPRRGVGRNTAFSSVWGNGSRRRGLGQDEVRPGEGGQGDLRVGGRVGRRGERQDVIRVGGG